MLQNEVIDELALQYAKKISKKMDSVSAVRVLSLSMYYLVIDVLKEEDLEKRTKLLQDILHNLLAGSALIPVGGNIDLASSLLSQYIQLTNQYVDSLPDEYFISSPQEQEENHKA